MASESQHPESSPPADGDDDSVSRLPSAERLKAFTDAVVAIALTLLILPLMDSVSESGRDVDSAWQWLQAEWTSVFTFVLSFVLIANFWRVHHQLFARVVRVTGALLWMTFLWLLAIVWLPVATAVAVTFPDDAAQSLIYVGSLFVASLILAFTRMYLVRHPELHREPGMRGDILDGFLMAASFLIALILMLAIPGIGYWAMTVLFIIPAAKGTWDGFRERRTSAQNRQDATSGPIG
ncbi:TMEM175 family protein [Microbacterium sediminicola]|uniref:TMEM175 family protein n=1 Tax=Microbacterium sediminicola TaxID=415210 RepID=A0ABN2IDK4_9MICO